VAEGATAARDVVRLIDMADSVGATIVATKDYHPIDHCSFTTEGGPFPPHCVQGSKGSRFYAPVGEALHRALGSGGDNVHIVHKAFSETIDSFGAFPYTREAADGRLSTSHGGCTLDWTGAFELMQSNLKGECVREREFSIHNGHDVTTVQLTSMRLLMSWPF
jgi:hypothetical protein